MIKQPAIYMKRKINQKHTLILITLLTQFVYMEIAIGSVTSSSWSNGTYTIEATISGPDSAQGDTDFDVDVEGAIVDGSGFDVYAYSVYENAVWAYNENHMVDIMSGNLVDVRGFNFGASHAGVYTFNKPPGIYTYTYVFGFRKMGHNYFDIAVELTVIVSPADN